MNTPISEELRTKLQLLRIQIEATTPREQPAAREAAVWDFFADLGLAIHQLELEIKGQGREDA